MNNKKYKYIVLFLLLLISIGFSVISTTLNIVGSTSVSKNTWDIHFENVQVVDGSVVAATPLISNNDARVSYSVTLNMPGDFYEFTVDVVNDGTIDGMLDSLDKTTLTSDQLKYLNYYVTYSDGLEIKSDDILKAGKSEKLLVHIDYKKDLNSSDLPLSDVNLTITIQANYKQADENANNVLHSVIEIVNKAQADRFSMGDEIKIGDEHFYYVNSSSDKYNFLAKYNLNVGDNPFDGTTGVQDSRVTGYTYITDDYSINTENDSKGTIYFHRDGSSYFNDLEYYEYDNACINENCLLYTPLQNYKSYLVSLGVSNDIDVNLPDTSIIPANESVSNQEEFVDLGINVPEWFDGSAIVTSNSWLYSTSYWLNDVVSGQESDYIDKGGYIYHAYCESAIGLRPYLKIPSSYFD